MSSMFMSHHLDTGYGQHIMIANTCSEIIAKFTYSYLRKTVSQNDIHEET
jgi:hypothetical protein